MLLVKHRQKNNPGLFHILLDDFKAREFTQMTQQNGRIIANITRILLLNVTVAYV